MSVRLVEAGPIQSGNDEKGLLGKSTPDDRKLKTFAVGEKTKWIRPEGGNCGHFEKRVCHKAWLI